MSTKRQLQIRPDFDTDVLLHPPIPTSPRHRNRSISISSTDSDSPGTPKSRRFSLSEIFTNFSGLIRQTSFDSANPAKIEQIDFKEVVRRQTEILFDETIVAEDENHK
uniref:Uncharacterized protein n=1 Tax=Panagrolaimus sp. JU765 TaxID=591449 RepID=A0AC34Q2H3_9BILA